MVDDEANDAFRNKIKDCCTDRYRDTILRFNLNSTENLLNVDVTKLGMGSGHTYGKVIDYDHRRPLHLAAAEGYLPCVKYLIEECGVETAPRDRCALVVAKHGRE